MTALSVVNMARRKAAQFYATHDIWLSPTTAVVAPPWGTFNLSKPGITMENFAHEMFAPACQYTLPHNIMGTPAMSLPLAMHSSGLPIGVQLAGKPAEEHLLLQLATTLEQAMPWAGRIPMLHVSKL
jgi:amidase